MTSLNSGSHTYSFTSGGWRPLRSNVLFYLPLYCFLLLIYGCLIVRIWLIIEKYLLHLYCKAVYPALGIERWPRTHLPLVLKGAHLGRERAREEGWDRGSTVDEYEIKTDKHSKRNSVITRELLFGRQNILSKKVIFNMNNTFKDKLNLSFPRDKGLGSPGGKTLPPSNQVHLPTRNELVKILPYFDNTVWNF